MRLIQLHSDFMEYTPVRKEIEQAEENVSNDKVRLEDLVVILTAVENGDNEKVVYKAVEEIKKYLNTVKSEKLLIYPYAHLSSNLASPKEALAILILFENTARNFFRVVHRAPFGWTKAFNIQVKGHPLAENAKEINSSNSNELSEKTVEAKVQYTHGLPYSFKKEPVNENQRLRFREKRRYLTRLRQKRSLNLLGIYSSQKHRTWKAYWFLYPNTDSKKSRRTYAN